MLRSPKLDGRHSQADQDRFRQETGDDGPAIGHGKLDRIARALIQGDPLELSPDAGAITGPGLPGHGRTIRGAAIHFGGGAPDSAADL
jgi:hypothetical protein